jgi:TatD DNase family protein
MFEKTNYIDIHSHLNIAPLSEDTEGVLERMREKQVASIIVGVDYHTSKHAVTLAEGTLDLWATIGLHPTDNDSEIFDIEKYLKLAEHPKVVAIGECGLDYFRSQDSEMKQSQKELFLKHIELATRADKPLMIHARPSKGTVDAYEDTLDILEKIPNAPKANFHFFVGNIEIARRILALGGTMSFDGPITFSRDYDELIRFIPLESMHAETDAPFAAPAPYRGKLCEPWMVEEIVRKIAEIQGLDFEQVQVQLVKNAQQFFDLTK